MSLCPDQKHHNQTPIILYGFLTLLLAGCAGGTPPGKTTDPAGSLNLATQRYQADQNNRHAKLGQWQVDGFMEWEGPDDGRRFRITMLGEKANRVRLKIYGPMRQVVMELLAGPRQIRLVNPGDKTLVVVPSSPLGMFNLAKIYMHPIRLLQAITGIAGRLTTASPTAKGGERPGLVTTQAGERLKLDPETGRILERYGQADSNVAYTATYSWPEPSGSADATRRLPLLPSRLSLILPSKKTRFDYHLKHWQFPTRPFPKTWFSFNAAARGFRVVNPQLRRPN